MMELVDVLNSSHQSYTSFYTGCLRGPSTQIYCTELLTLSSIRPILFIAMSNDTELLCNEEPKNGERNTSAARGKFVLTRRQTES